MQVLHKLGISCPDLEDKIRSAEASVQGKHDLKAVLGKLNAAEAHVKRCTEHHTKLEDQLAASKEKSRDAVRRVAELSLQRDQLLADKGYAKAAEKLNDTTDFPSTLLATAPPGISDGQRAEWEQLLRIQQEQFLELKKKQQQLLDSFKSAMDTNEGLAQPQVEPSPPSPQGNLAGGNLGDGASVANGAATAGTTPALVAQVPATVVPPNALTKDEAARARAADRQQEDDANGNFKRIRDNDVDSAISVPEEHVEAELEARLQEARAKKAPKVDSGSVAA